MSEHTQIIVELAPILLAIFGGIVAIYVRLGKLETKMDPLWTWWNDGAKSTHAKLREPV